ncbi:MAG: hypothetical protein ABR505_08275 [Actinomycetota bacterium]
MRRLAVGVLSLVLLAPTSVWAGHQSSFNASGSCIEYAVGIPVDAAKAQALVPEGFNVLQVGGRALVSTFAQSCSTSVDESKPTETVLSGIFVFVDPTTSPGGCQAYGFAWGDSSASPFLKAMRHLGWTMEVIPDSNFDRNQTTVAASVPSRSWPWSTGSSAGLPPPARVPFVSVHCHVGPSGLVRLTVTHDITASLGAGPVEVGDGELWSDLGAESQTTAGALFEFTWSATAEIIE